MIWIIHVLPRSIRIKTSYGHEVAQASSEKNLWNCNGQPNEPFFEEGKPAFSTLYPKALKW